MKKIKLNVKIDWQSKLIDILIVIVGISISFKLNNWNESIKSTGELQDNINSFYDENSSNESRPEETLEFSQTNCKSIDTLKQQLIVGNFDVPRIMLLSANMLAVASLGHQ